MDAAPTPASSPDGPLSGYRVLELGSTVAGPFCGRLLADFGAEVIKVEPAEGDPVRTMGKRFHGKSLYAASIFRNKSLIGVDLRKPEGQAIVAGLAAKSDVLVENFRPGALEKWGLGYEALRRSIIEAAGNPVLAEMLDTIYEKTQALIRRILILPGRAEVGRQQHVALLEAMVQGKAELAEQRRREGLRSARAHLEKFQKYIL